MRDKIIEQYRGGGWQQLCRLALCLTAALLLLAACGTPQTLSHKSNSTTSADNIEQQIQHKLSELLDRPVMLYVEQQNQNGAWKFWVGHPINLDGSRVEIANTPYQADYAEGYFDDVFTALSKSNKKSGLDDLMQFDYGSTDAPFIQWAEQHRLPLCVFSQFQPC